MNLVGSSAGVLEGKVVLLSANNELRLSIANLFRADFFFVVHAGDFLLRRCCWALRHSSFDQPATRVCKTPFELKVHPDL